MEQRDFSEKEKEFVRLFQMGGCDFDSARKMLAEGLDINACTVDETGVPDETLLTEVFGCVLPDFNRYFKEEDAETRKMKGLAFHDFLMQVVPFFLENGYDVHRKNGWYGAVALGQFLFFAYPRYLADIVKMLINAGARDGIVYSDDESTALGMLNDILSDKIIIEGDFCGAMEGEALYRILKHAESGLPYEGIDNYRKIVGKRINRVLADGDDTLYFCYDGGVFILDKKMFVVFTDTVFPDNLPDVSGKYQNIFSKKCVDVDMFFPNFSKESWIKLKFDDGTEFLFKDET